MNFNWSRQRLNELAEIIPSGVDKKTKAGETPVRLCNYLDVYNNDTIHSEIPLSSATATESEIRRCILRKGDVVVTKDSETPDDIGKPAVVIDDLESVVCGYHLAILRPNQDILNGRFLAYVFRLPEFRKRLAQVANGAIRFGLTASALESVEIWFPRLPEQLAIVEILSSWDRGIKQLTSLITAKFRFKQGVMQQLLNGRRRFRQFSGSEFQQARLGEVLVKVAEPVKVDPEVTYREIGIRSHGKGIFHKEPVSGRSLGNKRVYPVVPGCLTLNIVFAWERALAVTTEREGGMIASHRFPMFQPDLERLLPKYALHYLLSHKGTAAIQLASPGGAGRNRTLSQTQLLKTIIPLPPIAEQQKVVALVETADREIERLRQQLDALKNQKMGLMQRLFTDHVRVKP